MTIENTGFVLTQGTQAYDEADHAIHEWAKINHKLKTYKNIVADGEITSLETREQLLNGKDGLTVQNFEVLSFFRIAPSALQIQNSFNGLVKLFRDNGEDLLASISNYEAYFRTAEQCGGETCSEDYIAPPIAFEQDREFVLGAIKAAYQQETLPVYWARSAYEQTRPNFKSDVNFSREVVAIAPELTLAIPQDHRRVLFAENDELLLKAISLKPGFYKRYATEAQMNNPEFKEKAEIAIHQAIEKRQEVTSLPGYSD